MTRHLSISSEPIDEVALLRARAIPREMGAIATFLGVVRASENSKPISGLDYEAYHEMAAHQFHKIFDQVESCWPIASIRLVHRIGFVAENEPSLWLEVISPHRAEAFAACQFIVEEMKKSVPIWKKAVFNIFPPLKST